MKKNTEKRLSLGKIKVASLSKPDQEMVKGGQKIIIIRCSCCCSVSACAQQCC